ncbi:MAG: 1,6-anhydro-N-acetylmuramyl-L-alanine amidase AmpD [Pseudomonadota bacterium]
MKVDEQGWFSGVQRIASPNFDARPAHTRITLLVIHSISLPPNEFGGSAIRQLFTNTLDCTSHPYYQRLVGVKVSSHFLVRRDGRIIQFVACRQRAWHAGVSEWQGRTRCNDFSLGIELEGCDDLPFDAPQYDALARLTRYLRRRFSIADIVGHSDIAPGRKTDPGPCFEWARYLGRIE